MRRCAMHFCASMAGLNFLRRRVLDGRILREDSIAVRQRSLDLIELNSLLRC
jgi:hypothetical protein